MNVVACVLTTILVIVIAWLVIELFVKKHIDAWRQEAGWFENDVEASSGWVSVGCFVYPLADESILVVTKSGYVKDTDAANRDIIGGHFVCLTLGTERYPVTITDRGGYEADFCPEFSDRYGGHSDIGKAYLAAPWKTKCFFRHFTNIAGLVEAETHIRRNRLFSELFSSLIGMSNPVRVGFAGTAKWLKKDGDLISSPDMVPFDHKTTWGLKRKNGEIMGAKILSTDGMSEEQIEDAINTIYKEIAEYINDVDDNVLQNDWVFSVSYLPQTTVYATMLGTIQKKADVAPDDIMGYLSRVRVHAYQKTLEHIVKDRNSNIKEAMEYIYADQDSVTNEIYSEVIDMFGDRSVALANDGKNPNAVMNIINQAYTDAIEGANVAYLEDNL